MVRSTLSSGKFSLGPQRLGARRDSTALSAQAGPNSLWIVMAEFAPVAGGEFAADGIDALMKHLDRWHPTGLWDPGRCAIQLQVPAPTSAEALRRAMAHHRQAARAAGLPGVTLLRAEVLTVEEVERSWDDGGGDDPDADGAGCCGLFCDDVYSATRGLTAATTAAEVVAIVQRFVDLVGATTEPGVPRYLPGTCDIDLRIDGGAARHASAEALSVAGLMLESVLPTLLTDARRALARLQQHQP